MFQSGVVFADSNKKYFFKLSLETCWLQTYFYLIVFFIFFLLCVLFLIIYDVDPYDFPNITSTVDIKKIFYQMAQLKWIKQTINTEYYVRLILPPKAFYNKSIIIPVGRNVMLPRFPFIFLSQLGDILI